MKTPDEIKRALKCCADDGFCSPCPYRKNKATCMQEMNTDALNCIERLQAERLALIYTADTYRGLCTICKHERKSETLAAICQANDYSCDNCAASCSCQECIQSHGAKGFAWYGGTSE